MKRLLFSAMAAGLILSGTLETVQAISINDIKLNNQVADAAVLVEKSNDFADDLIDLEGLFSSGNEFTFITKDDPIGGVPGSGVFDSITFTLLASGTSVPGTWTLSWSSVSTIFPLTVDLVAVLKAGNSYAAFLFNDELLRAPGTNISDPWKITFTNNGNQIPNLSHFSLYGRDVTPQTPVPEPGTLLLFGSGLLGFASLRRKKLHNRE